MKNHFLMMVNYNAWANARLYAMAAALPDDLYRREAGVYFKSLHGTLNHLLTADLIWMHRLDGAGDHPGTLGAIVIADLASLSEARTAEDQRIIQYVEGLSAVQFDEFHEYRTLNGTPQRQVLRDILAHLFNGATGSRDPAVPFA